MLDYKVTREKCEKWRIDAELACKGHHMSDLTQIYAARILSLLEDLDVAKARAEKAEANFEHAQRAWEESSGFIDDLLNGLNQRFPAHYAELVGYSGMVGDGSGDAFSAADVFKHVVDAAVRELRMYAQKAEHKLNEARFARDSHMERAKEEIRLRKQLEAQLGVLAHRLAQRDNDCVGNTTGGRCPRGKSESCDDLPADLYKCWIAWSCQQSVQQKDAS